MTEMIGCDGCTLCCKLMSVESLDKPRDQWCSHCHKGHGCRIYETRPQQCRDFECYWLQSQRFPEGDWRMGPELRPDRCHVVIAGLKEPGNGLAFHVDPGYRGAHNTNPALRSMIDRTLQAGMRVIVACGKQRTMLMSQKAG